MDLEDEGRKLYLARWAVKNDPAINSLDQAIAELDKLPSLVLLVAYATARRDEEKERGA